MLLLNDVISFCDRREVYDRTIPIENLKWLESETSNLFSREILKNPI